MIIQLVIDKNNNNKLFVFVNDYEIGKWLFNETPTHVVDVKTLPGETRRSVSETSTHKVIIIESSFSTEDYIVLDKSTAESLLTKSY